MSGTLSPTCSRLSLPGKDYSWRWVLSSPTTKSKQNIDLENTWYEVHKSISSFRNWQRLGFQVIVCAIPPSAISSMIIEADPFKPPAPSPRSVPLHYSPASCPLPFENAFFLFSLFLFFSTFSFFLLLLLCCLLRLLSLVPIIIHDISFRKRFCKLWEEQARHLCPKLSLAFYSSVTRTWMPSLH